MGILNYVPTFKVVEPNRLTAPNTGQVLSQFVADQANEADLFTTKNETYFLENGVILGLNSDLEIGAYSAEDVNTNVPADASHPQPFLHYTEELVTILSGNNKFALEADEDGQCYPRGLALYVGDTFTTDNYTEDLPKSNEDPVTAAATIDLTTEAAFATVIDGKIILQETKDQNGYKSIFAAEASTLPTGEDAVRVTYLGA